MRKMQRILSLLLVLVLIVLLTGCQNQDQGFTLRISLPHELTTLDPAMVTTETEKTVVSHLYENLMKLSDDGAGGTVLVNGLASNYHYEDNLDGTQTYTFHLRQGLTWSDGKPLKASDFVFAWQRLVHPATESPNAHLLDMVAGYEEARETGDMSKLRITAEDDWTLVVVLSHSCLQFPHMVCTAAATMPVRQDVVQTEGWSMTSTTLVTNGAYRKVTGWENGVLTVSSVEEYYDYHRLSAETLQFSCGVADEAADFVLTHEGVPEEEGWNLGSLPRTGTLVINQMTAISEELRQALSLTIDRQQISDLLGSIYVPADGLIPAGIKSTQGETFLNLYGPLIDNDPEQYEARCQTAKDLLQGQKLPSAGNVSLIFVSDSATDQVAEALQKTWREQLGLSVTLRAVEREELETALYDGDFAMALVMLECKRNDAADMLLKWTSTSDENYANISNRAYDLLMRISQISTSAEARDAYLVDAERLLLESGHVVPICFATDSWRLAEQLKGVCSDGMGRYFFHYVTQKEK